MTSSQSSRPRGMAVAGRSLVQVCGEVSRAHASGSYNKTNYLT